jgi:hypothetical protein
VGSRPQLRPARLILENNQDKASVGRTLLSAAFGLIVKIKSQHLNQRQRTGVSALHLRLTFHHRVGKVGQRLASDDGAGIAIN